MKSIRQIFYFKKYFQEFFDQQTEKVKSKIDEVLFLITIVDRVPKKILEHLKGTVGFTK